MKKNAVSALAFTILWVAYCLVVILPTPQNHSWVAVSGLVLGSVFMWLCGWLLLALARRCRLPTPALVLTGAALLAADLGAKALVDHFLRSGNTVELVPGWLVLRFAPNYSNNVLLNLLGIVVESGLFHALVKLAIFAAVAVILAVYCRRQNYDTRDNRFRLAATLLAAGALSSIIESGFRGYIIDFISFATIVSFDIKDLCLLFGGGLLMLVMVDWERAAARDKPEADSHGGA